MAGANLSGDLREPSKAIPKGTLMGVSFTFAVYFTLFLLTGLTCNRAFLYHDCLYMSELEFWKPFVSIGALVRTGAKIFDLQPEQNYKLVLHLCLQKE